MRNRFGERLTCFNARKRRPITGSGAPLLRLRALRLSGLPDRRDALRKDPDQPAGLVLCDVPVLRDAERRGRQGSAAPARRDLQDRLAHVPSDPALYGLRRRRFPIGGPGKTVEADETFIGGLDHDKPDDKAIVLGMIERGGDVVTRVVQARTKQHILPHIVRFVKEGSRVHTDEASNFKLLNEKYGYDHEMVDHSAKEYVRGDVHTNSIESFWSQVKRGINGTYVWVSKKHLQLYLREFEYRHNLRRSLL